jgi:predicted MFS family arabinose efflux permease
MSKTTAFYLQASIILTFLAGSSAPTPLYAVYQAEWGFSPITVTVIFGIYAVAVLATLLVLGSLSDYVGRRPVLVSAALVQVAAMAIFASAHNVETLVAARVIQGIGTGAAAGAVGAGMLDIDRQKGAIANSVAPMIGTATGGMVSGLMIQWLPAPTKLVYVVLGTIFAAQALGAALMPETVTRRPGALASLKPSFELPRHVRTPMLLAAPALVGSWALIGFYGSLGPSLVRRLVGGGSLALGGLVLFVMAASGVLMVLTTRARTPHRVMTLGTGTLIAGVAVTLVAISRTSIVGFFAGTAIAGAGFGASFQGAVRSVTLVAAPHERAGVLSILYVIAYLAMGLPAVAGGFRVVHGGGLLVTAREYGLVVIALAAFALAGSLIREHAAAPRGTRLSSERASGASTVGGNVR